MEEKMDLRVKKTRKALQDALRALLCEKSFDDVTVEELCRRAQVRRATFYKHFGDKSELLAYMIQELQRDFSARESGGGPEAPGPYCTRAFRHLLDFLEENERIVRTIMASSARYTVLEILSEQIETDLKLQVRQTQKSGLTLSAPPGMIAALYSGAAVSCARWWLARNGQVKKEELTARFAAIMDRLDAPEE
ncbi:MAG TPA: TetR/AcrR family transcriptional regulator [Candidatus Fournierella merdigallinarum]|nr:TetR/AcrR family transcriptional regulator [Candidatus Fournierella merdigallinarum]